MKSNLIHATATFLAAFALPLPFLPAADQPTRPAEAPLVENLKELKSLNRRIVGMAGSSSAATVSLISKGGGGAGSGVVVSEDGIILTAAHVIAAMSGEFNVIFPDGTRKTAKALGADFDRDAAMAKIVEEGSYPHVALGDSDALVRNDWCIALGHPGGFDPTRTPPVRLGRVLRKEAPEPRERARPKSGTLHQRNFLITDSAVVGGDSGGPLFDADGRLIGIHSNIGATLMENRHVPISVYKEQWEGMKSGERTGTRFAMRSQDFDPNRPVLGVQLGEPDKGGGVVVDRVIENTPAAKAGLEDGDIITEINNKAVATREELIELVGTLKPGGEITVSYRRGETDEQVNLKLARLGDLARQAPDVEREEAEDKPSDARNDEEKGDALSEEELKKRLGEAMRSGQLEMTPDQLERIGGVQKLHEYLRELAKDLDPEARIEFHSEGGSIDPFYASSAKAITPVTRKAAASTVAMQLDGKPVALGTVVSEDNRILTKDTETRDGVVTVEIDGAPVPAKLLKRFPKRDLALYQVEAEGLQPVRWRQGSKDIPVGSLLTSSSAEGTPLGFGLLSVKTRAMGGVGFLGISGGESEQGVLINSVVDESAAKKAGLRQGDIITALNGKNCSSPVEFGHRIRSLRVDEQITLTILRENEKLEIEVTLGERKASNSTARFRNMNKMSGPLSDRVGGFPSAIQHDIPLLPSECGGPLLDLNGRCIGINVSRAGRVRTFAIPGEDLRELLAETEVETDLAVDLKLSSSLSDDDQRAILKAIEDLQRQIDALEKRVRQVQGE